MFCILHEGKGSAYVLVALSRTSWLAMDSMEEHESNCGVH